MRFSFILLLLSISMPFSALKAQMAVPESLTIDRTIQLVVANHPAIKQAQQQVVSAQARIKSSRSPYYPNISALGSYARIGPVVSLEVPNQGAIDLYPENNYDIHLSLQQNILDFGRRSTRVKLAESGEISARDNVELMKSSLVYVSINIFYAMLLLEQNIKVLDEELDAFNQHLDVVKKRLKAGTATDFDVLTTQVKVSEVQNQKIDAVNTLAKQKAMFRELTGIPDDEPVYLKGDFNTASVDINLDSLTSLAFEQLPEVKLAQESEARADIQYRLAGIADRPTLNMNLEFGVKNGYIPDLNKLKANWIAGVLVNVPIFNGLATKNDKAAAYADLLAARESTSNVKNQVAADIKQAISDFRASEDKVKTSTVQVEQAQAATSIARSRYEIGVITNLDLLDAQTSLAYAKLVHFKALYGVISSRYALDKAVGKKLW